MQGGIPVRYRILIARGGRCGFHFADGVIGADKYAVERGACGLAPGRGIIGGRDSGGVDACGGVVGVWHIVD